MNDLSVLATAREYFFLFFLIVCYFKKFIFEAVNDVGSELSGVPPIVAHDPEVGCGRAWWFSV